MTIMLTFLHYRIRFRIELQSSEQLFRWYVYIVSFQNPWKSRGQRQTLGNIKCFLFFPFPTKVQESARANRKAAAMRWSRIGIEATPHGLVECGPVEMLSFLLWCTSSAWPSGDLPPAILDDDEILLS
jgi:hypothetical protein